MEIMLDFNETIELFITELRIAKGANSVFEIDFKGKQILITEACSSFVKQLCKNEELLTGIHNGKMTIQYFK